MLASEHSLSRLLARGARARVADSTDQTSVVEVDSIIVYVARLRYGVLDRVVLSDLRAARQAGWITEVRVVARLRLTIATFRLRDDVDLARKRAAA